MLRLEPARTAVVAIDMHRGHLDPAVATLPLAAERCGPVIKRAAALFADVRARGVAVVHVVTEYRDAGEIAANPFWKAAHDFDEYGNPIQNIYVRKVERVGGRLQNTVIHTFPGVSQFWTYKPEEFLRNPVYSRDYRPCKAC